MAVTGFARWSVKSIFLVVSLVSRFLVQASDRPAFRCDCPPGDERQCPLLSILIVADRYVPLTRRSPFQLCSPAPSKPSLPDSPRQTRRFAGVHFADRPRPNAFY
ncbi:hypothetical protein AAFF_G00250880 [Aldrovandia affinis]|uniref:Secreted protein n=1 Tax=Aldrovandia affinis TaxID=143900 RepID=A0AAD7W389_9TELE|nr:hypothetical protein AAFF_G00250880 [Aldrovandia affinis]